MLFGCSAVCGELLLIVLFIIFVVRIIHIIGWLLLMILWCDCVCLLCWLSHCFVLRVVVYWLVCWWSFSYVVLILVVACVSGSLGCVWWWDLLRWFGGVFVVLVLLTLVSCYCVGWV